MNKTNGQRSNLRVIELQKLWDGGSMYLGDFLRQGVDGYSPLFPSMSRPTYSIMMKNLVANGQSMVNSNSEMVVDSGAMLTYLSAGTFANLADTLTRTMGPLGYFRTN